MHLLHNSVIKLNAWQYSDFGLADKPGMYYDCIPQLGNHSRQKPQPNTNKNLWNNVSQKIHFKVHQCIITAEPLHLIKDLTNQQSLFWALNIWNCLRHSSHTQVFVSFFLLSRSKKTAHLSYTGVFSPFIGHFSSKAEAGQIFNTTKLCSSFI